MRIFCFLYAWRRRGFTASPPPNPPPTPAPTDKKTSFKSHPPSTPASHTASSSRREPTTSSSTQAATASTTTVAAPPTSEQYTHIPKPPGLSSPRRTQSPIGRTSSPRGRHVSPMMQRAAQSPTRATQYRPYTSTSHQGTPNNATATTTPSPSTAPSRQGSFYDRSMSSSLGASQNCMPIRRGASFTKGHPSIATSGATTASSSLGPATYYASEALKNSVDAIRVVRRGNSPSRGGGVPLPPQRAPPSTCSTFAPSSHNVSLEGDDDCIPTSSRPAMRAPPRSQRTFTAPQVVVQQHQPPHHQGPPVASIVTPPPPPLPVAVDADSSNAKGVGSAGGSSPVPRVVAPASISSSATHNKRVPTQHDVIDHNDAVEEDAADSLVTTTTSTVLSSPLLPSSPTTVHIRVDCDDHYHHELSPQRALLAQGERDARLAILRAGVSNLSSLVYTFHQVLGEVLYPQYQYRRAIVREEEMARGLLKDTVELLRCTTIKL